MATGGFVVNSVGASPKFTVTYMNDLLHIAVDAHGGVARWNRMKMLKDISIEASAAGLSDLPSAPSMARIGLEWYCIAKGRTRNPRSRM